MFDASQLTILATAIACLMGYLWLTVMSIRAERFPLSIGALLGSVYFVLIPTLIIGISGTLEVPADFRGAATRDLNAAKDGPVVLAILAFMVYFCCTIYCMEWLVERYFRIPNLVFTRSLRPKLTTVASDRVDGLDGSLLLALAIYLFIALLNFFMSGMHVEGGHWYKSRELLAEKHGVMVTFLFQATGGARLTILVLAMNKIFFRRSNTNLVLAFMFSIACLDMLITANRLFLLQLIVATFIFLVSQRRHALIAAGLAMAPIVLYAMSIFRQIRGRLYAQRSLEELSALLQDAVINDDAPSPIMVVSSSVEVIDYFALSRIIQDILQPPYVSLPTFLRPFTFYFPKTFWPDRPIPISDYAGRELLEVPASVNPLLLGEALVNSPYIGIPIAAAMIIVFVGLPTRVLICNKQSFLIIASILSFSAFRQPLDYVLQHSLITCFLFTLVCLTSRVLLGTYTAPSRKRLA